MKTSVLGYPRIGRKRELKKAIESYFKGSISAEQLEDETAKIRLASWKVQRNAGISYIPSNDFSLYDNMLDTAILFGLIPRLYREAGLSGIDTLFAMARGYQDDNGTDITALPMRKWFNTNYHYIVPSLEDDMVPELSGSKPIEEYCEARSAGIDTRPTIIGPFTFVKLAHCSGKKKPQDFADALVKAYSDLANALRGAGAEWLQFEEPSLATDLTADDKTLLSSLYAPILVSRASLKSLLAVPFGDIRDCYQEVLGLGFDSVALDFVEGPKNLELIERYGFPANKILIAGVISGKNVWRNDRAKTAELVRRIARASGCDPESKRLELGTSCSLLHVPVSTAEEKALDSAVLPRLAFAEEKLAELVEIAGLLTSGHEAGNATGLEVPEDPQVRSRIAGLAEKDFIRSPSRKERRAIQQARLNLPPLPTTTIGSFPQTDEVREVRASLRKGTISHAEYNAVIRKMVSDCVARQEEIGLDVLVHGEFERNDMVEFFGQNLNGFIFTSNGWVQSYGTRCVKPPIIISDVSRRNPITVDLAKYAQSTTKKPVKGMLTGPVTILNWSFPREDIPLGQSAFQIALAIRDEVLDLERNGIGIIQIDEAALREKMPLRKIDRKAYFDWAIPAFRLVHSGVKPQTQIHTHMCYSDFTEILREIDSMDADVISFEASRSKLELLDYLASADFETAVGAGVYDIHSPRVPSKEEIVAAIETMLVKLGRNADRYDGIWINPDCGLKTRGNTEVWESLGNLVQAAKRVRDAQKQ